MERWDDILSEVVTKVDLKGFSWDSLQVERLKSLGIVLSHDVIKSSLEVIVEILVAFGISLMKLSWSGSDLFIKGLVVVNSILSVADLSEGSLNLIVLILDELSFLSFRGLVKASLELGSVELW